MALFKFPDRFCADSRPYWALFACFVAANILLLYTLYTRQPERYRSISGWLFSRKTSDSVVIPDAQAAAFGGSPVGAYGMMPPSAGAPSMAGQSAAATARTTRFLGMTLQDVPPNQGRHPAAQAARHGLPIVAVDKNGPAYLYGLKKGDALVSINRIPASTVAEFERITRNLDGTKGVLLDVYRGGRSYYITIEPGNPTP